MTDMLPIEAIESDPPNVWLTSLYGFDPEEWGVFGFSKETDRDRFVRESQPGALVVVYGAHGAPKHFRSRIIGIQQCAHDIGPARNFMSVRAWQDKENDDTRKGRWEYGVRIYRAWEVTRESMMDVKAFAPETTKSGAWQHIGAAGVRLTRDEAQKILELDLREMSVYGTPPILAAAPGPAEQILAPTRAGPVSQSACVVRETEGPKYLYVLKLSGDASVFLGDDTRGRSIFKVGISRSPHTRSRDLNKSFPANAAFAWEVVKSTFEDIGQPYANSAHAVAGENAMKAALDNSGRSLGGEFFLADWSEIENAWIAGKQAAGS